MPAQQEGNSRPQQGDAYSPIGENANLPESVHSVQSRAVQPFLTRIISGASLLQQALGDDAVRIIPDNFVPLVPGVLQARRQEAITRRGMMVEAQRVAAEANSTAQSDAYQEALDLVATDLTSIAPALFKKYGGAARRMESVHEMSLEDFKQITDLVDQANKTCGTDKKHKVQAAEVFSELLVKYMTAQREHSLGGPLFGGNKGESTFAYAEALARKQVEGCALNGMEQAAALAILAAVYIQAGGGRSGEQGAPLMKAFTPRVHAQLFQDSNRRPTLKDIVRGALTNFGSPAPGEH